VYGKCTGDDAVWLNTSLEGTFHFHLQGWSNLPLWDEGIWYPPAILHGDKT